jgi:hypothetical protein
VPPTANLAVILVRSETASLRSSGRPQASMADGAGREMPAGSDRGLQLNVSTGQRAERLQ